jgi:hypothetical protein
MFIIYSLIAGIVLGYLAGGNIRHLGGHPFKHIWIAVSAFSVQLLIFSDIPFLKFGSTFIVVLHLASYAALLAFIFLNKKTHGIVTIGMGIFLNSLVIFLNKGYMPTSSYNLAGTSMSRHAETIGQGGTVHNSIGITGETLIPWLGDIFRLPSWIPFSNVFSIGDVIIAAGVCIYFVYNMKPFKTSSTL